MSLTSEEKGILLKAARKSIESAFIDVKPDEIDLRKYPALAANSGAFVTITKHGELRGCIGFVKAEDGLYTAACRAAIAAAMEDRRFYPLVFRELAEIEIEISVLFGFEKMNSYDDIVLGVHGLLLTEEERRGLLLPQVPKEHGWNLKDYLSGICQKAGLPSSYWEHRILNIELFQAEVFSEKEFADERH
jgi:AmmeMemoRadiSam system protein A